MHRESIPWLRVGGLAGFIGAVILYQDTGYGLWFFLILFLVPDITFPAYAINTRVGAFAYNVMHTYTLPIGLMLYGVLGPSMDAEAVALVWFAHIGMDRLMGYGLKLSGGFRYTHLTPDGPGLAEELEAEGGAASRD